MFTMPWSPTQSFPHPLAVIHQQDCKRTVANFVSYAVVDMMVWEGLGDLVNTWRKKSLSLDTLDSMTAPSLIHRLQVPCSYLWSPAVLPKPADWGDNIDICGFSFLPSDSDYKPTEEIDKFLKAGPPPIYVGFGSIVVDDQVKLTRIIFEAVRKSGQRAMISKGWGNLGIDDADIPENILIIGSVPHDWLFRQVTCVIHHGGAGTTAAGLALGRPTIIIPFFGDQEFWGGIVARAGAGPLPIPHKRLTVDKLSEAINMALKDSTREKAQAIAKKMEKESGVKEGVLSFHRQLDLKAMRCCICPSRPAVWHMKRTKLGFSAFAASVLVGNGSRAMEYDTYRDPIGPLSASAQVLFGAISNFVSGLADVPTEMMLDIVSAGKAIGHAHPKSKPQSKWHQKPRDEDELASDQSSTEHTGIETQQNQNGLPSSSHDQELEAQESEQDEDEEMMDLNGDTLFPETELEKKHSQELDKLKTMRDEIMPSHAHNMLYVAASHGRTMSMKFINVVIWLPTDLALSMSKGFHNAPKLYHDRTVKSTPKVKGVRSGFRAAGREFRDGWYDGVTGLVTQPRYGYKNKGTKGMFKGIGKGIGGVFLKPPAALWGLAGYPLSGIRRTLLDSLGRTQECHIIISRIAQGREEMRESSTAERAKVAQRWSVIEEKLCQGRESSRQCPTRRARPVSNL
ncbi:Sterol 3-beta-glucosyltransferase UGT80B1 [Penicillium verhagenii]|nr:Sterol 3-beta-glucosyltransferase UGT80B1 [Penicillium verhagenii]